MKGLINKIKSLFLNLRKVIVPAFFIFIFILFVSFAERGNKKIICSNIDITIHSNHSNDFLKENDIKRIIKNWNNGPVKGKYIDDIDRFSLENELNNNSFIESSQVFCDLNGTLYIDVIHRTPIIRIKANSGADYYIDINGLSMPISRSYAAKSLVFTGNISENDFKAKTKAPLYKLGMYIDQDPFLKALIGQVYVDSRGEIFLIPKIGNIIIEYGKTENIETKFIKLKVLYKKILPVEGWDKYKKASLKYNNQIVLKKK